jgi:hypothetical protein
LSCAFRWRLRASQNSFWLFSTMDLRSKRRVKMKDLRDEMKAFIKERDWEQFHSPKNLAMALSVEVAEVVEHFQ